MADGNGAHAPQQQQPVTIALGITTEGRVVGMTDDKVVAYGLLELMRDAIYEKHKRIEASGLVLPPGARKG